MSQEEKQLLIKVLCEMMSYGVKVNISASKEYDNYIPSINDATIIALNLYNERCNFKEFYWDKEVVNVRPYLRPMSSMTKDEKAIYSNYKIVVRGLGIMFEYNLDFVTEWLLKHHFDYRGLIEKSLALEAPEGMYNIK